MHIRKLSVLASLLAGICAAQVPAPKAQQVPDWVSVEANIPYDSHPETVLDILQSKKTTAVGRRPGVIVIHGGGWVGGTKESVVRNFCLPYLEKGFVVANVEYRLAKAAPAPAAVEDVLKAANWFRDNARRYNVDRDRIVVTGGSAGGHLALMVGMVPKSARLGKPAKVAAVVNFYGITDVGDQLEGPNMRKYAVTWVPEQEARLVLARRVSPASYVRKDLPAILTIHGDADETVPYEHGVNLTRELRDEGADAELIPIAGGKHGFSQEQLAEIYPKIFAFLERRGILK
ncbi:MAG: alpha/beta hydrolase [Bryobacterales bacterium]|nr:alpha/beta hydrolase [Bryobacterales bacterium]MEB2363100.1 alpha/beta hydrolase [Bryobacterales bacterium]